MLGDTKSENRCCIWTSADTGVAYNKQIQSPLDRWEGSQKHNSYLI